MMAGAKIHRRGGLPAGVLALMAMMLVAPAVADIPLPDPDRDRDAFAEQVELGPIEALDPVTDTRSRDGAGRLPQGVTVETAVELIEPVQRETFLVTQTIFDPARRLRDVEVHRPAGEGIDARLLDVSQDTVEVDGRLVGRRHYRWAVQALRPGEVRVAFSRIDFEVVGSAQSEFAFVPVARQLTVTALPAHLPEYLPVSPDLAIREMSVSDLVAGEPGQWRFVVVGEGLTEKALEQMLTAQLVAPAGLRLGAPSIRADSERSATEANGSLAAAWEVRLSVLPAMQGETDGQRQARLPALRLPFIDRGQIPPGGEIVYAWSDAHLVSWQAEASVRWRDAVIAALPWVALGLAGAWAALLLARRLWRVWRTRRAWVAARKRLAAADRPRELRRALRSIAAELPVPVRPVSRAALAERGASESFLAAVARLDQLCFARAEDEPGVGDEHARFTAVREEIVAHLPRHWFR